MVDKGAILELWMLDSDGQIVMVENNQVTQDIQVAVGEHHIQTETTLI